MFLSAYHFDGDPEALVQGWDRLVSAVGAGDLLFNVCVRQPGGMVMFDGCPSRDEFEAFVAGSEFAALLATAGLPTPRLEPLGEVHQIRGAQIAGV